VSTRPAGLPHPWGVISCRKAALLTYNWKRGCTYAVGYIFGWLFLVLISLPYLVNNDLTAVPAKGVLPVYPGSPLPYPMPWRLVYVLQLPPAAAAAARPHCTAETAL